MSKFNFSISPVHSTGLIAHQKFSFFHQNLKHQTHLPETKPNPTADNLVPNDVDECKNKILANEKEESMSERTADKIVSNITAKGQKKITGEERKGATNEKNRRDTNSSQGNLETDSLNVASNSGTKFRKESTEDKTEDSRIARFSQIIQKVTARLIDLCRQVTARTSIKEPVLVDKKKSTSATLLIRYMPVELFDGPSILVSPMAESADREPMFFHVPLQALSTEIEADYELRDDNATSDLEVGQFVVSVPPHFVHLVLRVNQSGRLALCHVILECDSTVCFKRVENDTSGKFLGDIVVGDFEARLSKKFWELMNDWIHGRLREAVVQELKLTELKRP